MSIEITLYLINVLPAFARFAAILSLIGIIVFGFASVICFFNPEDVEAPVRKWAPRMLGIFLLVGCFACSIPNERGMLLILGASAGKEVLNSDTGKKVQQILLKKLEDALEASKKP